MGMPRTEATVLRAIAVIYRTEVFAETIMDLAKLSSGRFYPTIECMASQGLVESREEELPLAVQRPRRLLYSLSASGTAALTTELSLPPAETLDLRNDKSYSLQTAPDQKALSENLQATIFKGLDSTHLTLQGGQKVEITVSGLVLSRGGHTVHGDAPELGMGFTATVIKHRRHPSKPDLDMVFGSVKFAKYKP